MQGNSTLTTPDAPLSGGKSLPGSKTFEKPTQAEEVLSKWLPVTAAAPERTVAALTLAFIAFQAVTGGPFGIEAAVGAAGPLPTIVGVAGLALLWGLPQGFMTGEDGATLRAGCYGGMIVSHCFPRMIMR